MDNKFFIYNVAKALSEKTGKDTSEIDRFLKEFALIFNEGVTKDDFVKVKGIGAFKVVLVKERESVHVNTGERIVIPPHHKLSFIPEKKLRDMINKPFALFEAIEAQEDDNGLINLTVAGKEVKDLEEIEDVGEIGDFRLSGNDVGKTEEMGAVGEKPMPPPWIPPIEEKPLYTSPPPPPLAPPIEGKPLTPAIEEKPLHVSSLSPSDSHKKVNHYKKKNRNSKRSSTTLLLVILFILLFILVAGAIYYFFFYNRWDGIDEKINAKISEKPALTLPGDTVMSDTIIDKTHIQTDTLALAQSEVSAADTTKKEVVSPATEPVAAPTATTPAPRQEPGTRPATTAPQTTSATTSNNNNVLTKVRIEQGQRLTLIAEKYYGNKVFWVYIYEYNKAKIGSNPNQIRAGMEILIPAKELYGINANSDASVDKATDIQRQIMEGLYR